MSDETIIKSTSLKKDKGGRSECEISFTPEEIAPAEEKAIRDLGKDVKLDGFRPGQAPIEVLKEKVDPGRVLEETVRNLMPSTFERIVKEHELNPIIPPKVEATTRDPLTVKIVFVEMPEVKVKGADKIKIDRKEIKVDDKDLQRMIDYIMDKHTEAAEVDRASKEGDRVTMDFYGEDKDGKEIEGTRTQGHTVEIGSKVLIPGFEDNLVGLKKGEQKTFTINFPEKYHAEHLQNAPVTFHVTMQKVEELSKGELTDEFVKKNLNEENVETFKKSLTDSMSIQEEQIESQRRENALYEEIKKCVKVDLAPELIEEEEAVVMQEFADHIAKSGLTYDQWLEQTGKKVEDLKKEFNERAIDRLTLRLGIQKIVEEKDIAISDEEIIAAIGELLAPLEPTERDKVAPMYEKGNQGWEQLKWQKRVEKFVADMLAA